MSAFKFSHLHRHAKQSSKQPGMAVPDQHVPTGTHQAAQEAKPPVIKDDVIAIPSEIKLISFAPETAHIPEPLPPPAPVSPKEKTPLPSQRLQEWQPTVIKGKKKFSLKDLLQPPGISKKHLIVFFDQLATLLEAGVPIVEALEVIVNQTKLPATKKLLLIIVRNIKEGQTFSSSLAHFPKVFPPMVIHLLSIGEQSGMLPELIRSLATKMEEQSDLKRKIRGAMIYPIIVISLSVLLVIGMMLFIVPRLKEMYTTANVKLPEATQVVIAISQFVGEYYAVIFLTFFILFLLLSFLVKKIPAMRRSLEEVVFRLPLVGALMRDKNIALLTSNLALLLKSGMLIDASFQLLKNTTGSLLYQDNLRRIREGLLQGQTVSAMLGLDQEHIAESKENYLFPLEVAQIIRVGEQTGNMTSVLNKISETRMKKINQFVKNMSSVLEPIMIVVVGLIIAGIIIPLMLPIFNIGSTVG